MNSLITLSSVDIAIIVGYIGGVIVLGVWLSRRHKNFDDYSQAYIPHMEKNTGLLMSLNVEAYK